MLKIARNLSIICAIAACLSSLNPVYATESISTTQATEINQQPGVAEKSPDLISHSAVQQNDEPRELSMFFKIGIGINIVMLIAYISWAVRQWKQSDRPNEK